MTTCAATSIRELPESGLFTVPGLRGAAVATGVKPHCGADLALIVADEPLAAAGIFTTNALAAAPVELGRATLRKSPTVRSIVINSGNANALTGPQGMTDALAMQETAEARCGGPALVLSTGVIGVPLPIDRVVNGIERASRSLTGDCGRDVARAILTTDTRPKTAAVAAESGPDAQFIVGGIAKGSGMIHPNMATMLAVIATDAAVEPGPLRTILRRTTAETFHRISVDGDTSTNDAVVLLAQPPRPGRDAIAGEAAEALEAAVTEVCRSLAEQIVSDGEGITRTMDIRVSGARNDGDAARVAEAIARSTLVKTALAGADPNWGRVLAAAGNAGIDLAARDLALRIGDQMVFEHGSVRPVDAAALATAFSGDRVRLSLSIGTGSGTGRMITSDLSTRYVEINSTYTT